MADGRAVPLAWACLAVRLCRRATVRLVELSNSAYAVVRSSGLKWLGFKRVDANCGIRVSESSGGALIRCEVIEMK